MSDAVRVIAVIAIVAYVIGRQLLGEPLRGRRVVLLPVILTIIGAVDLGGGGHRVHPVDVHPVDIACLAIGGVIAAGIGAGLGWMLRLEDRDGYLWGQMPVASLWLWLVLIVSRLGMTLVAGGLDAKVAASGATTLLMLGVNRLGQAIVVLARAMTAGVPFAPEKDGASYLEGLTGRASAGETNGSKTVGIDAAAVLRQVSTFLEDRRRDP